MLFSLNRSWAFAGSFDYKKQVRAVVFKVFNFFPPFASHFWGEIRALSKTGELNECFLKRIKRVSRAF